MADARPTTEAPSSADVRTDAAAAEDRARLRERLRRQALELEQVSAMKSQFLANISHELRTPLHAVVGYTSLLLQGVSGELGPEQREKLERIDENASHLLMIIDDLIDLTRLDSGQTPVDVEEVDLRAVLEEARAESEELIAARDLDVTFEVEDGVSAIHSDRAKIEQIVHNLLTNALEFTPAGSVDVRARPATEGEGVEIEVADTGVGIPEEEQGTIFEAFGQSERHFHDGRAGTGLGLSICKRLANVLGGNIRVESEPGEGSTFTLTLPQTLKNVGRAPEGT